MNVSAVLEEEACHRAGTFNMLCRCPGPKCFLKSRNFTDLEGGVI